MAARAPISTGSPPGAIPYVRLGLPAGRRARPDRARSSVDGLESRGRPGGLAAGRRRRRSRGRSSTCRSCCPADGRAAVARDAERGRRRRPAGRRARDQRRSAAGPGAGRSRAGSRVASATTGTSTSTGSGPGRASGSSSRSSAGGWARRSTRSSRSSTPRAGRSPAPCCGPSTRPRSPSATTRRPAGHPADALGQPGRQRLPLVRPRAGADPGAAAQPRRRLRLLGPAGPAARLARDHARAPPDGPADVQGRDPPARHDLPARRRAADHPDLPQRRRRPVVRQGLARDVRPPGRRRLPRPRRGRPRPGRRGLRLSPGRTPAPPVVPGRPSSTENPNIPRGGTTLVNAQPDARDGFDGPVEVVGRGPAAGGHRDAGRDRRATSSAAILALSADASAPAFSPPTWRVVARARSSRVTAHATSTRDVRRSTRAARPGAGSPSRRRPNLKVEARPRRVVIRPGERVSMTLAVERAPAFKGRVPIDVREPAAGRPRAEHRPQRRAHHRDADRADRLPLGRALGPADGPAVLRGRQGRGRGHRGQLAADRAGRRAGGPLRFMNGRKDGTTDNTDSHG